MIQKQPILEQAQVQWQTEQQCHHLTKKSNWTKKYNPQMSPMSQKKPYKRRQLTQNEQTFQCNSCPKAFGHKQSLVRHERIHLNPDNA